mmetsp:Transcript_16202/g.27155  ORF Transcript_16202/g.27155 Transcript_16202/m.27155 type:complete len:94 (-) Transcript_16202:366-647(-)
MLHVHVDIMRSQSQKEFHNYKQFQDEWWRAYAAAASSHRAGFADAARAWSVVDNREVVRHMHCMSGIELVVGAVVGERIHILHVNVGVLPDRH